jgi:hypothetical protein
VLLTPSRDNFVAALRDLNDDWLNECGGYGAVTQVLSRVDVLSVSYAPSCDTSKLNILLHSATLPRLFMRRWHSRCSGTHGLKQYRHSLKSRRFVSCCFMSFRRTSLMERILARNAL